MKHLVRKSTQQTNGGTKMNISQLICMHAIITCTIKHRLATVAR